MSRRGGSGQRVTLRDVAERAGVHVSTVSRALDDAQSGRLSQPTIDRVKLAADELGYTRDLVATGLKRGRTDTVGVVVADLENPYNAQLIRGVARTLERFGMVAMVVETEENQERFERLVEHFMQRRVDAIITAASHLNDGGLIDRLVDRRVPVVLAVRGIENGSHSSVVHDDRGGGVLAAQHLIRLGHRHLAQLHGPRDIDTFVGRAEGFSEAVRLAGLSELSLEEHSTRPDRTEGRRLMELTLGRAMLPTAVFAPTDVMAVGALEAMAGRGLLCPDDISIVGYDDIPLVGQLSPPLTTIRLPSEEVGIKAAEVAAREIADRLAEAELIRLPAVLVERQSSRPPAV